MTRSGRRKAIAAAAAGLALSALAAGVVAVIVKHGSEEPTKPLSRDERAKIAQMIQWLVQAQRNGQAPKAVALREFRKRIERQAGATLGFLPALLGRLMGRGRGLEDLAQANVEDLLRRINEAASREGM